MNLKRANCCCGGGGGWNTARCTPCRYGTDFDEVQCIIPDFWTPGSYPLPYTCDLSGCPVGNFVLTYDPTWIVPGYYRQCRWILENEEWLPDLPCSWGSIIFTMWMVLLPGGYEVVHGSVSIKFGLFPWMVVNGVYPTVDTEIIFDPLFHDSRVDVPVVTYNCHAMSGRWPQLDIIGGSYHTAFTPNYMPGPGGADNLFVRANP